MRHQQAVTTGCFPPSGEFEPVFAMHLQMGSQPIETLFPYRSTDKHPVTQVALTHEARSQVYDFTFAPTDWHALEGEHSKTYEVVVDQDVPTIQLSTFGKVLHSALGDLEQKKWRTFQLKKGLFLPHEKEVKEFLRIFWAYINHITSQEADRSSSHK